MLSWQCTTNMHALVRQEQSRHATACRTGSLIAMKQTKCMFSSVDTMSRRSQWLRTWQAALDCTLQANKSDVATDEADELQGMARECEQALRNGPGGDLRKYLKSRRKPIILRLMLGQHCPVQVGALLCVTGIDSAHGQCFQAISRQRCKCPWALRVHPVV
jgi:hypothetical protein